MKQEQHEVLSTDHVKLCVNTWPSRPSFDGGEYEQQKKQALLAVIVHPYTRMGGSQAVTQGLAESLCLRGFNVVTFDLRGAGKSTGHASFTGEPEVGDVMAVCRWAADKYSQRILLVGSSAGAPIAGSALPHCPQVDLYVGIGYTFGIFSSLLFGSHYAPVLAWAGPKLFIMGAKDEFTTKKQLEARVAKAQGVATTAIVEGVGHFGLEGPAYDQEVAKIVGEFVAEQPHGGVGGGPAAGGAGADGEKDAAKEGSS
ncbi:hypothetical protein CLOM_g12601 [Closterium sp. NIES-68]|nr:hypothetical protein CLOM_g12601 [Closterium sp. NIES-68]